MQVWNPARGALNAHLLEPSVNNHQLPPHGSLAREPRENQNQNQNRNLVPDREETSALPVLPAKASRLIRGLSDLGSKRDLPSVGTPWPCRGEV